FLTDTDPVIVTEFGDTSPACSAAYGTDVIAYADAHEAGWTAWGWFPAGCSFPALIDDWQATPSPIGAVVRTALLGPDDPPASPARSGPTDGPDVSYQFASSAEGWLLDDHADPALTNLAVATPGRESMPTLAFTAEGGDPTPGAVRLTAAFTAFD